jgi:hypothetical protein
MHKIANAPADRLGQCSKQSEVSFLFTYYHKIITFRRHLTFWEVDDGK